MVDCSGMIMWRCGGGMVRWRGGATVWRCGVSPHRVGVSMLDRDVQGKVTVVVGLREPAPYHLAVTG